MSGIQPYTKEFTDFDPVTAETPTVLELRFLPRGTLKRIVIAAANIGAGTGTTGTVTLYTSEAGALAADPLFKLETFSLTANAYASNSLHIDWTSREGSLSDLGRKLYALVTLAGTGTKSISLSLTAEGPQF